MRLFFALEAEPATALQIADWRDTALMVDGRPVPPANFHITLAFVGELSHAKSDQLANAVDAHIEQMTLAPASLLLDQPGYWPKPGIFWLGPTSWPESLTALTGKLRGLATAAGARKDHNTFRPHVTLFRRCALPPTAPTGVPQITWPYSHFSLMESVKGKNGVSYRPMTSWSL